MAQSLPLGSWFVCSVRWCLRRLSAPPALAGCALAEGKPDVTLRQACTPFGSSSRGARSTCRGASVKHLPGRILVLGRAPVPSSRAHPSASPLPSFSASSSANPLLSPDSKVSKRVSPRPTASGPRPGCGKRAHQPGRSETPRHIHGPHKNTQPATLCSATCSGRLWGCLCVEPQTMKTWEQKALQRFLSLPFRVTLCHFALSQLPSRKPAG